MFADQPNSSGEPSKSDSSNKAPPPIENGYEADAAAEQGMIEEDDPSLLDHASRSLEASAAEAGGSQPETILGPTPIGPEDDGGDILDVPTPAAGAATPHPVQTGDWENELSAHRVAVELRRIEAEIRTVLEDRDPKRKRKFSGTHRWHELEDDIISWRFGGRFEEDTLRRLQEMIARRHHLFRRLRFLASTRPTWNT